MDERANDTAPELPSVLHERLVVLLERGARSAVESMCVDHPEHADDIRGIARMFGVLGGDAEPRESTAELEPPARYELGEVVGRGGIGVVVRARDRELDREVALKFLRSEHRGNPDVHRRFSAEARIGGRLQHPGVVPVYDFEAGADRSASGERDPCLAMKLVSGQSFAALLAARDAVTDDRARHLAIFERVCQTLAYAHDQGVVHRDLKPDNVLVGAFGEVQVLDWGFAKSLREDDGEPPPDQVGAAVRVSGDPELSQAGSVFGSLPYMPPEQARGEVDRLDRRSDVFGLGAILCEILTGAPPYVSAESTGDGGLLSRAASADLGPALNRLATCTAEPRLVELARSCLAVDRDDRPSDAAAVARELRAHLDAVEQRARDAELEAATQALRARQERRARRLTTGLAIALILGTVGTSVGMILARAAERRATGEAARAVTLNGLMRDTLLSIHPGEMGGEVRMIDVLREARYDPVLVQDHPDVEAEFNQILGHSLLALGEAADARARLSLAREVAEREHGPDHRDTLRIDADLGQALVQLGERDEGAALLERARARSVAIHGARDELSLEIRLAEASHALPRGSDERLARLEALLGDCRAALGEDDELTSAVGRQLAFEFHDHRRFDAGLELSRSILARRERLGDENDLAVLSARKDLAIQLRLAGRLEAADAAFDALIPRWRLRMGRDSVHLGGLVWEAGMVKMTLGRFGDAKAIVEPELERRLQRIGDRDDVNVRLMVLLADALYLNRELEAAEPWSARAVRASEDLFGAADPRTITARVARARLMRFSGRSDAAKQHLVALVRTVEAAHGTESAHLVDVLQMLAGFTSSEDLELAIEYMDRCAAIARGALPRASSTRLGVISNHGYMLARAGRIDDAEPVLLEALAVLREHGGRPARWRIVLKGLADMHTANGDSEAAMRYGEELRQYVTAEEWEQLSRSWR